MRGELTTEVQKISKAKIGREITITELRLIPYIQYEMVNNHTLEIRKISAEEKKVLAMWRKSGFIDGGASDNSLTMSKEFWDFIHEVLWVAYAYTMTPAPSEPGKEG